MHSDITQAHAALRSYNLQPSCINPVTTGLINDTYLVETETGEKYILQRINPIFSPEICLDIDLVTRHLHTKSMLTPRIISTTDSRLWIEHDKGIWRLLSYIPGQTGDILQNANMAREAGALLADFHIALLDINEAFHNTRSGVHDLRKHIQFLHDTLRSKKAHPRYKEISLLADEIFIFVTQLPQLPPAPARVIHGDAKISNIIFDPNTKHALCLIDLDTLTRLPLYIELGDAIRSWCNPCGEDVAEGVFSMELFRAAIEGYATHAGTHIVTEEWQPFVTAAETIFIELAARFCADALNESYFSWNPEKFPNCSEHNRVRTLGQLNAAKSLRQQRQQAEAILIDVFSSSS